MKNLKKISYLLVCALFTVVGFTSNAMSQERPRLVKTVSSQPVNQPAVQTDKNTSSSSPALSNSPGSRPVLTNKLTVATSAAAPSLVNKTSSSSPTAVLASIASRATYGASVSNGIIRGIQSRLGIPYLYGSSGPNRYDCSGFVWSVFNEAGISFERSSARSLWAMSEPVTGDERFKFGTLVFMNGLGHMGIVADDKGFYHASSSKGVTYSTFEGYWGNRIVGFRRLPQMDAQSDK